MRSECAIVRNARSEARVTPSDFRRVATVALSRILPSSTVPVSAPRSDSLASGHVVQVLRDYTLPEQEIHAVFPSPRLVPGKVQAFVAFLQGKFGARWWETLPKA